MKKVKDNNIVYIDLSLKKVHKEEISPKLRKEFMGGTGINTKILYDSEAMYHDALSEKNVLVFGVGPAVATGLIAGNRCTITAKSPITDIYGDSNIGGDFTLRMRAVGIDHLVFNGKAETPVYIHIDKAGEVHILDATDLWGSGTHKTTDTLMERHGSDSEVACIGPAGEKLVRYACVMMSKTHAAGRAGMGCVMGSKNIKAIVIERNKSNPPIYDQEKVNEIKKIWLDGCKNSLTTRLGKVYGSLFLIESNVKGKHLPIRNFKTGDDENAENIFPHKFVLDHVTKKRGCYACPVACSKSYEVKEGKYKGLKGERIEFGTAASLGPVVGVFDWPSILHLKLLTDDIGVDSMEFGGVIGLILECQERGIIKDVDGRVVKFGDVDDIEYLTHKLGNRDGMGDILAEGVYRIGKLLNAEDYAFCIKKASSNPPTASRKVRALGYITSTRGGDHLRSFCFTMQNGGYATAKHVFKLKNAEKHLNNPDKQGRILWWHENYKNIVDSLGVCLFAIQGLPSMGVGYYSDFAKVMNAFFNLDTTAEEVMDTAERIYQLQNSFNVNCGMSIDDYQWPTRKKDADIDDEFIKASTLTTTDRDAPGMLPEYFAFRGLSSDGIPTVKRFVELGLSDYIDKAKIVDIKEVKRMSELIEEVAIDPKFSSIDKKKAHISAALVGKLFNYKHKVQSKKYLKEKQSLEKGK